MTRVWRGLIEEYRELPEPVLTRDVAEVAVQNIEHMVRTFHDGFEIDGGAHEWLRRSAARRVHQPAELRRGMRG